MGLKKMGQIQQTICVCNKNGSHPQITIVQREKTKVQVHQGCPSEHRMVYFMENPSYKWMLQGYPHFRKPPYITGRKKVNVFNPSKAYPCSRSGRMMSDHK
jgi:hypothetical protein